MSTTPTPTPPREPETRTIVIDHDTAIFLTTLLGAQICVNVLRDAERAEGQGMECAHYAEKIGVEGLWALYERLSAAHAAMCLAPGAVLERPALSPAVSPFGTPRMKATRHLN